jgi:hypothetical protein
MLSATACAAVCSLSSQLLSHTVAAGTVCASGTSLLLSLCTLHAAVAAASAAASSHSTENSAAGAVGATVGSLLLLPGSELLASIAAASSLALLCGLLLTSLEQFCSAEAIVVSLCRGQFAVLATAAAAVAVAASATATATVAVLPSLLCAVLALLFAACTPASRMTPAGSA